MKFPTKINYDINNIITIVTSSFSVLCESGTYATFLSKDMCLSQGERPLTISMPGKLTILSWSRYYDLKWQPLLMASWHVD